MKQSILLIIFLVLLNVAFVQANEYVSAVQDQGTFPNGNFNQGLSTDTVASRSITAPSLMPLVADLDGNGVQEILVLDAGVVRIFHGSSLTPDSTVALRYYDPSFRPTTWIVADLNDDGKKEVIIPSQTVSGNLSINFLNYDGVDLVNRYNLTENTVTFAGGGEMQVGCDDVTNRCLLAYAQIDTSIAFPSTRQWSARFFNNTNMGNASTETASSTGGAGSTHNFCAPKIPVVAVADFNHDGNKDFTVTMLHVVTNTGTNTDPLRIVSYQPLDSNLSISTIFSANNTDSANVIDPSTSFSCRTAQVGNAFTSPLVGDFVTSGNDNIVVVATEKNQNSYGMYSYEFVNPSSALDDYPETFFASGTLVGNLFRADALDVDNRRDFCVSSFVSNVTFNQTNFFCGSILHSCGTICELINGGVNYNTVTNYNLSVNKDSVFSTMAGASQQDHVTYNGNSGSKDYDEVINAFGVFRFEMTFLGDGILTPIWYNQEHFNLSSQKSGNLIAVDVENVSASDLILLSPTNIFYLNDGFVNAPAELTNLHTNPCLNSTWKQNTTVGIDVTASDVNVDPIHCQAFLYFGTGNQQFANDSSFFPSGATHSFTFTASNITGSATGRVECVDDHNPTLPDSTTFSFSVNTGGVSFGDCQTNIGLTDVVTGGNFTNSSLTPSSGNVITNLLTPLNVSTGLGMTVIWLIIMALLGIGGTIALTQNGLSANLSFAVMGFVESLFLIVGVFLGFIGLGTLFTIVIIASAIAVIVVRQIVTGSR